MRCRESSGVEVVMRSDREAASVTKDTLAGILLSLIETYAFEVNQFDIDRREPDADDT